jgi:hypothetical protein
MKTKLHIPTEQYGYVEVETEVEDIQEALALYKEVKGGAGLAPNEYNGFIDRMLMGDENHLEDYLKMSAEQQACVQVIKRALKRLKSRE